MTRTPSSKDTVIVIGGGIAGIAAALELVEKGQHVTLVERQGKEHLGGLAIWAFGGMAIPDSPLQRKAKIRDSAELCLQDWLRAAELAPEDRWPRAWAARYCERAVPDIYEWLVRWGLSFMPAVQWPERGLMQPINTVPRYHILWGTSHRMAMLLREALMAHAGTPQLTLKFHHRVERLVMHDGRVTGCAGRDEAANAPFEIEGGAVVVASGGVTGNLDRVRENWPPAWGRPPADLLNGSHPEADGLVHDAVADIGGSITHLDKMWNYAAGVRPPKPHFAGHGLSLVPFRSALWLDHTGRRIGPVPLMGQYDTYDLVEQICVRALPYTWAVLNRKIAEKELAISGSEHNPLVRDRKKLAFLGQLLRGNRGLVDEMLAGCPDFVSGTDLAGLAVAMNHVTGNSLVTPEALAASILPYDAQIARGPKFHNDDQLRRIAHLRAWTGDRLRTSKFAAILDPASGPLIAVRQTILVRKSMGGIATDLQCRALDADGVPMTDLYAIGEASGFGGGGASGKRSLEGTFLSGCILTARDAARAIAGR